MDSSGDTNGTGIDYADRNVSNASQFAPLEPGDDHCFTANTSSINSQVDLQKLGFNNQLQINDTAADVVSLNDRGREMTLNDDGSYQHVAQAGDSYWRVASDVLSARNGEKASDKEILSYVETLARYNQKADPNKLAIGEAIYIPPAVNDGSIDSDSSEDNTANDGQVASLTTTGPADSDTTSTAPDSLTPIADSAAQPIDSAPQAIDTTQTAGSTTPTVIDTPLVITDATPTIVDTASAVADTAPAAVDTPPVVIDTTPTVIDTTPAVADAASATTDTTPAVVDTTNSQPSDAPTATQPAVDTAPAATPTATSEPLVMRATGVDPQDSRVTSHHDIYSPIAPPGQGEAEFGTAVTSSIGTLQDRAVAASTDLPDGGKAAKYSGTVNNGWLFGWHATPFVGSEQIDKYGRLVHRDTEYNSGISMTVMNGSGDTIDLSDIKTVVTDRQQDGHYITTLTDGDGATYSGEAGATGQSISFAQRQ